MERVAKGRTELKCARQTDRKPMKLSVNQIIASFAFDQPDHCIGLTRRIDRRAQDAFEALREEAAAAAREPNKPTERQARHAHARPPNACCSRRTHLSQVANV